MKSILTITDKLAAFFRVPSIKYCLKKKLNRKGSMVVETALVLPLFLFGIITMISLMDVYRVQTKHLVALSEKTMEAGMYAYVADGTGVENITLPDLYSFSPVGILPIKKLYFTNIIKVHAWTGKEYASKETESDEDDEEMVYITETGTVYHRSLGCTYLNPSVSQVGGTFISSMRNSNGEKYTACSLCCSSNAFYGTVYITKKGNRYHSREDCSALKRNVKMVKLSEVGNMPACSRCGS